MGDAPSAVGADRFAREILGKGLFTLTGHPADMTISWGLVAVSSHHDHEAVKAVRDAALGMIRSCGAAHILFVAGAASEILGRGLWPESVFKYCRLIPGFEWLIERDDWFWLGPDPDNRLVSIAQKVLAVADRKVDVEEVLYAMVSG